VLERHRVIVLLLLSAVVITTAAIRARAKPFWHDEIYTILHSTLPSISAMWAASRDGIDLAPPLNSRTDTRRAGRSRAVGRATRLPAFVGYWTMTLVGIPHGAGPIERDAGIGSRAAAVLHGRVPVLL
jgi:hypothetical protein